MRGVDLQQWSDQLTEKLNEKLKETSDRLKETSALTRTLADRILQHVREFKETYVWPEVPRKVYHRQPSAKRAAGKMTAKAKTVAPKKSKPTPKKSSAKSSARKTRKK